MPAGRIRIVLATAVAMAGVVNVVAAIPVRASVSSPVSLPWVHVSHPAGARPALVDAAGRTVILRGPNLRGIEDDFYSIAGGGQPGPQPQYPIDPAAYAGTCPAPRPGAGEPPVCVGDLASIRDQGFNFVRLPVSWSLLEPAPGRYSTTYLDRITQVVGWARQQGIYVLVDMHQDNYSRFLPDIAPLSLPPLLAPVPESANHADGAPPWAVLTNGVPALAPVGVAELSAAVAAAFTSFWLNRVPTDASGRPLPQGQAPGPGLQDHYIGALGAVARRFANDSTVVGYEIMNEPLPGVIAPVVFSTLELYPFYHRVIDALTGTPDRDGYRDLGVHVSRQAFFFEPMAVRNLEDAPDQLALPFSSYPNLVYAPHDYTHVFTIDRMLGLAPAQSPYPLSYDQPYALADAEARAFKAALVCGEYGEFSGNPTLYAQVITGITAAQDRYLVGSSYWAWTGQAVSPLLARAYPRATAGTLLAFAFDPAGPSFIMTAAASQPVTVGDRARETEVLIPADTSGRVTVGGAAHLDAVIANPGGTRSVLVAPSGAGSYSVAVAAA